MEGVFVGDRLHACKGLVDAEVGRFVLMGGSVG